MTGQIPEHWFDEVRLWAKGWPRVAAAYAFGPWATGAQGADPLGIEIVLTDDAAESQLVFATANLKEMRSSLSRRLPVAVDLQVALPGDAIAWPSIEQHGLLIYQCAL
ncbi:hypothetical protein KRR38_08800 [Novosphingobium sp. G106]|uniref:hypothetical protein n=1 Tax=Novosphingobium sp. G106 TaxID=2849500 RepID=UPI001C2D001D|nr:hypothetical protein [Novosphingobium sp. G106]MBV1687771.1 hypothetical protein [Novosphingobium sp. G106]